MPPPPAGSKRWITARTSATREGAIAEPVSDDHDVFAEIARLVDRIDDELADQVLSCESVNAKASWAEEIARATSFHG